MKRILPYAGWGIALAASAGFLFQYVVNREQTAEIDLLSDQVARQNEKLASSAADMDAVMQRMEDTEATVLIWQDFLADAFSETDVDLATLPDEIADLLPDTLGEVEDTSFNLSKNKKSEVMANYQGAVQGTIMTEMVFGDFVTSLDVSPETREAVRDLIAGAIKESFATKFKEDGGQFTEFDMLSDDVVRAALESILTPKHLAEFDAYEEKLPEHMMRRSTNMQLQMLAGGLTEESRELVTEILIEEFSAVLDDLDEESIGPSSFGNMNLETYENARLRISELLAPDQLTIYDRYLNMLTAMS